MENNDKPTEASKHYAAAYEVHYEKKDLREAFEHYKRIIKMHQNTPEAQYAQSQINNIINNVVPKQDIFDAQVNLLSSHLDKHENPSDVKVRKNWSNA